MISSEVMSLSMLCFKPEAYFQFQIKLMSMCRDMKTQQLLLSWSHMLDILLSIIFLRTSVCYRLITWSCNKLKSIQLLSSASSLYEVCDAPGVSLVQVLEYDVSGSSKSVCVHLFRFRHLQEGPGTRPPRSLCHCHHHRYVQQLVYMFTSSSIYPS